MDPVTAGHIAGIALQIAQGAWSVGNCLYNFIQDVKCLEETAEGFASEVEALGSACALVNKRVESILQDHVPGEAAFGDVGDLMASLDRQLAGCKKIIDQLQMVVTCIDVEQVKEVGVWRRMVKQTQLSMKTKDIETVRNRIRSHTSSLQLTLQTIAIDVAYVIPSRVDVRLRPRLDEIATLRNDLVGLRSQRSEPEAPVEPDEDKILETSTKIISRAETLYSGSVNAGSILGLSLQETDTFIYDWIYGADSIDSESRETMSETGQTSIFSRLPTERGSFHNDATSSAKPPMCTELAHGDSDGSDAGSDNEFAIDAIQQAMTDGRAAFAVQDFAEANMMLREAFKMTRELPTNRQSVCDTFELLYMLGVCAFHLDEPAAAKEALLGIVDVTSKAKLQDDARRRQVLDAGHLLAQTYVRLGNLEAARSACDSVLEGRRRLLGKTGPFFESLALKTRITDIQGNRTRAKVYASMIPSDVRKEHIEKFVSLVVLYRDKPLPSRDVSAMLKTRAQPTEPFVHSSMTTKPPAVEKDLSPSTPQVRQSIFTRLGKGHETKMSQTVQVSSVTDDPRRRSEQFSHHFGSGRFESRRSSVEDGPWSDHGPSDEKLSSISRPSDRSTLSRDRSTELPPKNEPQLDIVSNKDVPSDDKLGQTEPPQSQRRLSERLRRGVYYFAGLHVDPLTVNTQGGRRRVQ